VRQDASEEIFIMANISHYDMNNDNDHKPSTANNSSGVNCLYIIITEIFKNYVLNIYIYIYIYIQNM